MRVLTAGLFEVPIKDQQKSSANITPVATEFVQQTILARPFATARSTWLATTTVKTRAGSKLSGTAVDPTPLSSKSPVRDPIGLVAILKILPRKKRLNTL